MPILSWLLFGGLLFFGVVQILAAWWLVRRMRDLVRRGQRATARPVRGLFEFSASDGRVGRVEGKAGFLGGGGAEVTVIYDPDDLENATIASWAEMWLAPTLLGGSGAMIALASIVAPALLLLGVLAPAG